jgi:predicted TIM-barrel fold metal-dependent hydrolase
MDEKALLHLRWSTTMTDVAGRPYAIVSSDAHAGASLLGYRDYLDRTWHEEFDAWSASFRDAWAEYDVEMMDTEDEHLKIGAASFLSPYNWDSDRRLGHMEADGIAAEVIFPNTVPPFYPSGVISAPAPSNAEEYRRRWAGLKAHNRWLVDFCGRVPGRRAGIAQVFLDDVGDAVREVARAREAGLAGVLIPSDHIGRLVDLYLPRLDPFWAACSDLEMPVHRHGIVVGYPESPETGPAAPVISVYESSVFSQRGLSHLIFGGVFQRYPQLKFVFTETRFQWMPVELKKISAVIQKGLTRGDVLYPYCHGVAEALTMSPSEYFEQNCHVGASGMTSAEVALRHQIGVNRLMWGADYPHHEGTWPHTKVALRLLFSDIPEGEVRKMTSENAARLYGFDPGLLQSVADRVGPSVAEIATPATPGEIPQQSMCETFGDGLERLRSAQRAADADRLHWSVFSS